MILASMTGGAAVAEALETLGVRVIFDLPGLHTLPIYDAMYGKREPRRVMVKHEGNGAVMADTYGRLTGEPGVALVTSGPGATNSLTGVAQAYGASAPLLHVSSTIPPNSLPCFVHGVEDPDFLRKIFSPVTKWSTRVKGVRDIANTIIKGFSLSMEPRKGPVHIDIPSDLLSEESELQIPVPKLHRVRTPSENKGSIARTVALLARSRRPVVYAGKEVLRESAWERLLELVESLGAVVVTNTNNPEVFPSDHQLYAGNISMWNLDPPARMALDSADLILTVGVRWDSVETIPLKSFSGKPFIQIDVDGRVQGRDLRAEARLLGDIKDTLSSLLEGINEILSRTPDKAMVNELRKMKVRVKKVVDSEVSYYEDAKPIHPGLLASELRKVLSKDDIVTLDAGTSTSWFLNIYAIQAPNTLLWPGAYSSMGFALPAAIAAKIVHPDRQVVAVTGDGGFLMSYMDLPTVLENNLRLVVIIANDSKYTSMWHYQRLNYEGRYIGIDLPPVNYASLAESFGGKGIRVEDPSMIGNAYREALESKVLTVVDIVTDFKYPPLSEKISREVNVTNS